MTDSDKTEDVGPVGRTPSVTVVVGATDAARVRATLHALDGQIAPPGGWKTTVHLLTAERSVADVVAAWVTQAPALRSVEAPVAHDPTWRIAALRQANSDVVAFLAEGSVVPPTWVVWHARTFERAEVAAAIGSVGLCWLVARPAWWTAEHDGWLGVVDVGDHAWTLGHCSRLSAYNTSVRRRSIEELAPDTVIFDDDDTDSDAVSFVCALRRNGSYAVHVPEAPVIRQVRSDDVATTAMLRRGWVEGRRSITSDATVGRPPRARARLAAAEVVAAARAMRRSRANRRVDGAAHAIAGSIHLGRAVSMVESNRKRNDGR